MRKAKGLASSWNEQIDGLKLFLINHLHVNLFPLVFASALRRRAS